MAAGHGGRNNRADLILRRGASRDTQQGLHCGQKYKENKNILNPKFLTNWPRSVEGRSVLSIPHSLQPLRQTPSDANVLFDPARQSSGKLLLLLQKIPDNYL